jgi:hypothetical protein
MKVIDYNIRMFVELNINHKHMNLCGHIVESLGIDSIESFKTFDFNNKGIPAGKLKALIELQNKLNTK